MKKVLEMFGEPITYGGQESVVYNMLSVFDLKNEFNVDLFTPYYADNENLINLVKDNGGNVISLNIEFKTFDNRFLLTKPIENFFKSIKKNIINKNFTTNEFDKMEIYDIVHIHTGSLMTMCMYARLAKKYGVKKVIAHAHSMQLKNNISTKIRKFILFKILKKYVDIYMGCSEGAIKIKFPKSVKEDAIVVNNGIDIDKFKFSKEFRNDIRKQYNLENLNNNDISEKTNKNNTLNTEKQFKRFVVGSIGRINYVKNNKFMIDIIANIINFGVKDIILLMVGDGEDLESVKEYAKDLGVCDYVIFAGNKTDAYKYYSAFDIFIMPSLYEGLGISAVEAQVSGLIALLSNTMPHDCSIAKTTEFLDISDPIMWAKKIIEIKKYRGFDRNTNIDFDKFDRRLTYTPIKDIYRKC